MVKVSKIDIRDYNVCISCRRCNPDDYMYKITSSYKVDNQILNNIVVYCPTCLFNLLLELNSMFQLEPMLDGSCKHVQQTVYEKLGMPRAVFYELESGRRISAIKTLRDLSPKKIEYAQNGQAVEVSSLGLKEAKDKVDHWCEVLYGKDYLKTKFKSRSPYYV